MCAEGDLVPGTPLGSSSPILLYSLGDSRTPGVAEGVLQPSGLFAETWPRNLPAFGLGGTWNRMQPLGSVPMPLRGWQWPWARGKA